jgi:hypothetical protein
MNNEVFSWVLSQKTLFGDIKYFFAYIDKNNMWLNTIDHKKRIIE